MNDKDLLYFCKLVETQSYTLTANTFNVTQPTISMAIKRLQRRFSDPLISQKIEKVKLFYPLLVNYFIKRQNIF